MTRRYPFKPDLTVGEMALLFALSHLTFVEEHDDPAQELASKKGVSVTVIRNALSRISSAVGTVQEMRGQRKTLRPNPYGRNIGQIGYLAARLCSMASDKNVDQALLSRALVFTINQMNDYYEAGHFKVGAAEASSSQESRQDHT